MRLNIQTKQTGFSLIEMMVAMVIGLFLMGGVVSVYISSTQSSRVNTSLRTLQENGRFALATLRNSIQMAGYIDSYDPSVLVDPFPGGDNDFFKELTVRYQSDTDCTGASTAGLAAPNTGFAENTIEVKNGELICSGNVNGADAPETIIDGVDQMRVLYGLDDNNDGIADRYVSATTVTSTTNGWRDKVSSVRIALLLNSIENVKNTTESKTYQVLDGTTSAISDNKIHKVFTSTILIRNRMI